MPDAEVNASLGLVKGQKYDIETKRDLLAGPNLP